MNAVLERAYEYIRQLKCDHEKIMDQKLPPVSALEIKKLQENNRHMQSLLTRYSTLLKMAGISLNAVPSDIEISSCKSHKIPQYQRQFALAPKPILPKPCHENSVNMTCTAAEGEDASSLSSGNASDAVNDERERASKEPDSKKSPRGSNDSSRLNLAITSPSSDPCTGSCNDESESVSTSGVLIDRTSSANTQAAQVASSKESRVAKILPHIKASDGLITFPQVIAPNTSQIVILRSNDTTGVNSTSSQLVTTPTIIGSNSNLALSGQSNLILGPQLLGLSASPTLILPSGQIVMTQPSMSTTTTGAASGAPLILSSNFLSPSLNSAALTAVNSIPVPHSTATHASVTHSANQETDQSSISISQSPNSLFTVNSESTASFDDDVRAIEEAEDVEMTNDSRSNLPVVGPGVGSTSTSVAATVAASASVGAEKTTNSTSKRSCGKSEAGTSASHSCINGSNSGEENLPRQLNVKPDSQSQVKSSTVAIKASHGKVTACIARKRKLLLAKSKYSHKKAKRTCVAKQVTQTRLLIEQALKSIQNHFKSSSKVNCNKKKKGPKQRANSSMSSHILASPAETSDILMLDNLSQSNSPLSPSSVTASNSSLPNFLCLSPTADQLSDFLQQKESASPVSHNGSVSTVSEVTSNINTCSAKSSELDNSRNNNSSVPITVTASPSASAGTASSGISSVSNFLNENTHQDKQQHQTRKQTRQTRRSGVHLDSQEFETSDQQQQVPEQLTQSQSQQQARRTSYMAESLIRQQPVASSRSQMTNVTPHDVTFNSTPASTSEHGASTRNGNSSSTGNNSSNGNNSNSTGSNSTNTTSHPQQADQESNQLSNLYSDSTDAQVRVYSSPNVTSSRSISYSAERLINASQNSSRRDDAPPGSSIVTRHSFSGSNFFFEPPSSSLLSATNDLFSLTTSNGESRTPGLPLAPLTSDPVGNFETSFNPCFASAGRNYLSPVPGVSHTSSLISAPISSSSTCSSFPPLSAPSTSQSGVFSFAPLTTSHHLSPTHHSVSSNGNTKAHQRTCNSNGIMNNSLTSINPFAIASDFNSSANPSFISAGDSSTPNHYPYIRNSVSSSVASSSMHRSSESSSSHVFPLSTCTGISSSSSTLALTQSTLSPATASSSSVSAPVNTSTIPPPPNPYLISATGNSAACATTGSVTSTPFGPLSISASTGSSYDSPRIPPPLFSNSLAEQLASLHNAPVSRRSGDHRNQIHGNHNNNGKSSKVQANTTAASTNGKGATLGKKSLPPPNGNKSNPINQVNHNSSANHANRNNVQQLNSHQISNLHANLTLHPSRRMSTTDSICQNGENGNSMYAFSANDTRIHTNQRMQQQQQQQQQQQLVSTTNSTGGGGHGSSTSSASNSGSNGTSSSSNNASNGNGSTSVHSSSASSSIASHARNERTDGNFNYSNNSNSNNNGTSGGGNSASGGGGGGGGNNGTRSRGVLSSRTSGGSSSSSAPITTTNRTSGVTSSSPASSVSSASNSLAPVSAAISSSSSSVALFAAVAAAAAAPLITDQTPLTSSSTSSIPFTLTAVPPHASPSSGFRLSNILQSSLTDFLRPTSASTSNVASDVNHFSHAASHFAHQPSHLAPQNQSQANLPHLPPNISSSTSSTSSHNLNNQQHQNVSANNGDHHSLTNQTHQMQAVLSLDENNTSNDPSVVPQFNVDCYPRQSINHTSFPSNGNIFHF